MHEQTYPPTYKTGNWPAYDEALERRASLTIWFDPGMSWEASPSGTRGRQQTHSGEEVQKTVRDEMRSQKHRFCSIERAKPRCPDERHPDLPDDDG